MHGEYWNDGHDRNLQRAEPSDQIVDSVRSALAGVLRCDAVGIDPDSRLFDDLGLDSTSALELLTEIETDLHADLDVEDLQCEDFITVRTLAVYVQNQIAQ